MHRMRGVGGPAVLILMYCSESGAYSAEKNNLPDAQPQTKKLRLVDEPVVDGVQRQFETVGDAEFIEDVVQVVFDGLLRDENFFADFLVAESLGDELDDFLFAIAEQRFFAARPGFSGLRKSLHDRGRHAVAER